MRGIRVRRADDEGIVGRFFLFAALGTEHLPNPGELPSGRAFHYFRKVVQAHLAHADGIIQFFAGAHVVGGVQALEGGFIGLIAQGLQGILQGAAAIVAGLLALGLEIVRHHGAGAVGNQELEPFGLRLSVLGRDDFHLVSGVQNGIERHQMLVHLGGNGLGANLRMDGVGKVQGGGTLGQAALLSLGSEDIDVGGGEVVVDHVQQLHGIHVRVGQDFLDAVQPGVHLVVSLSHGAVLLVNPVRGKALLRNVVHAAGAYLHLHPHARRAQQRTVQGLVAVGLGMLHPVSQALRHVAVNARNDGENMVALVTLALSRLGVRVKDDADGIQVIDLLEADSLGLHLVPDRIGRLNPLLDFKMEARPGKRLLDGQHEVRHFPAFFRHALFYPRFYVFVSLRLLETQPDVLHFRLDAVQAQPMRQRNEDEHGLGQNLVPLVLRHVLDGAAVVQAVGQFDEHHPHVVVEGKQDALEILRLHAGRVQHVLDFGEPVHQQGNPVSETLPDVLYGIIRVFHHVVQEGGRNGLVAQADIVHHNLRHGNGMQHIRFSAAAPHVVMGMVGKVEGLPHHSQLVLVGAALLGRCLEHLPCAGNQFIILLTKLRKTHTQNSVGSTSCGASAPEESSPIIARKAASSKTSMPSSAAFFNFSGPGLLPASR